MAQTNGSNTDLEILVDNCSVPEPLKLLESYDTPNGGYTGVVLATLDGPVMDYTHPTRNDRQYIESLCDEVHDSEYVQELLSTKNALGEPDHPMRYQNRSDIHYPDVSHAWRNFRKVPEAGCYYATFDILDTPNGRILKTLLDYGVQLGVSSRGSGRTITRNGKVIVDPATYRFITFDIVCMPGNKVARLPNANQSSNESIEDPKSLTEQVESLLSTNDLDQLRSVQPVLSFLNETCDVSSLLTRVNEAIEAGKSTTSTDTASDLLEAYSRIRDCESRLASKDSMISALTQDNQALSQKNQLLQNTNSEILKKLDKVRDMVSSCTKREQATQRLLESQTAELEKYRAQNSDLSEQLESSSKTSSLNESLITKLKSRLESQVEQSTSKINTLTEALEQSQADLDSLTEQLDYKTQCYQAVITKYVSVRCSQLGLNESLILNDISDELANWSTDQVDQHLRTCLAHKPKTSTRKLTESLHQAVRVSGTQIISPSPRFDDQEGNDPMLEAIKASCKAVKQNS